jgi:membrane-bound lytic murein transglycosylase D
VNSKNTRWFQVSFICLTIGTLFGCQSQLYDEKIEPTQDIQLDAQITELRISSAAETQPKQSDSDPVNNLPSFEEKDLWDVLRSDLAMDHQLDKRAIQQEIRWFRDNPEYWQRLQTRMQTHLPYILERVLAADLPAEIALLPIIESALDPYAFSPYGANGLWQFMSPTAKQYGLKINSGYDGRRDIIASTDAALTYLTYLYKRFDSWPLAFAAYNAGEGTVSQALMRSKDKDFFALRLPRETRNYVPRLLAIAAIVNDPAKHQITLPEVQMRLDFFLIQLPGQFDIAKIVEISNLTSATLYKWNPSLKRSQTPITGPNRLLIPYSTNGDSKIENDSSREDESSRLQQKVDLVPEDERLTWLTLIVESGQTLSEIAEQYHTDTKTLRLANGLKDNQIFIDDELRIPLVLHSAAKAQSVFSHLHTIRAGESLWSIAQQYRVSVNTLAKTNQIGRRDLLHIGDDILIPDGSLGTSPPRAKEPPEIVRKIRYKVRNGDSLSRIAQKFKVRVAQIGDWNDIDPGKYLRPGQPLILYVNAAGGR